MRSNEQLLNNMGTKYLISEKYVKCPVQGPGQQDADNIVEKHL